MHLHRSYAVLLCFVTSLGLLGAATRYHEYSERFRVPNDPATPVAAGYLGGEGDEYLSGAAVLPDGTVLLAGTCFGPSFALRGVAVTVLGTDGAAPAWTMPTKKDKQGKLQVVPPDWSHRAGAGFIVQLAKGHGAIAKAVRFPWGSGSLTDLQAAPDGALYVAGLCGVQFAALTQATEVAEAKDQGEDRMFLARLNPDLGGFAWCRTFRDDASSAPKIKILQDGTIGLVNAHAYHVTPAGKVVKATAIGTSTNWVRGVDFQSHANATGGDGNTNTGWEPWRQPVLFIRDDQGEHVDTFYRWHPKLVGLNWSRLVSDSSIRALSYDNHGKLLVVGWSDGGNSVLDYVPYDLTAGVTGTVKNRTGRPCGLGFSTWGAGVGSFCHIIRIDPETGEPLAKTLFVGYLASKNTPSGLGVRTIDSAADNSVLLGGGAAWGLIETGSTKVNTLDPDQDYMGGTFIAVLNGEMSDIRFSSALPGGGQVPLLTHSRKSSGDIAVASARVGDQVVVVFVGGAVEDPKFKTLNTAQQGFGGGTLDGQYVILTMKPDTPPVDKASVDDAGEKRQNNDQRKDKDQAALTGTFRVAEGMDRPWCLLALRDGSGKLWPTFYLCGPSGNGSVDAAGKGSFTIRATGDQAELISGGRQKRLGGHLSKVETYQDKKGNERQRRLYPELEVAITLTGPSSAKATIRCGGKEVTVEGSASIRPSKPCGKGIQIGGRFTTTKGALGLAADEADATDPVTVEYWAPGRP